MMIKLLNAAVMPRLSGTYSAEKLTLQQFVERIQSAEQVESYIGYLQTAELISEWTGIEIPVNRDACQVKHGDQLLIARLKYRPDVQDKGTLVAPDDFEFVLVRYSENLPPYISSIASKKEMVKKRRAEVNRLRAKGLTAAKISEQLNVSEGTIFRDLTALGLPGLKKRGIKNES